MGLLMDLFTIMKNKSEKIHSKEDILYNQICTARLKMGNKFVIRVDNTNYYKYFIVEFKKNGKQGTLITRSYECNSGSTYFSKIVNHININDFKQIFALSQFYCQNKGSIVELNDILHSTKYDFSVLKILFENTSNLHEELMKGDYGLIRLCSHYIDIVNNKNNELGK